MNQTKSKRKAEIRLDIGRINASRFLAKNVAEARRTAGYKNYKLLIDSRGATYPNICVPLAAVIEHFKTKGFSFEVVDIAPTNGYVNQTHFDNPFSPAEKNPSVAPFDVVWRFSSSEDIEKISSSVIETIRKSVCVSAGIIDSVNWCLYEIMDNVLQHSEAEAGFFMGSILRNNHRIALCIADAGIGILSSLGKSANHHPTNDYDAITLALQERVTRDPNIGQGNGLWGLREIVKTNKGILNIQSGSSGIQFKDGDNGTRRERDYFREPLNNTTVVDFQFDFSTPVEIDKILNTSIVDLWKEEREIGPEGTTIKLLVSKECDGTGTRKAGASFRTIVLNSLHKCQQIDLDFSGINIISSSFADELISKLLLTLGLVQFVQRITLSNVSQTIASIINQSTMQRMACGATGIVGQDLDEKTKSRKPSLFPWRR